MLRLFTDLADGDDEFTEYMFNLFLNTENSNLSDPYIKLTSWLIG